MKILLLPFLNISSGHHQAADALMTSIGDVHSCSSCKKVDILQYSYQMIEPLVSAAYLKWIGFFPGSYSWIYRNLAYRRKTDHYYLYEAIFLKFMERLLIEEQPDYIFCTHSLPSYLLNRLKSVNSLHAPTVNVYTDYFINDIWGIRHADYHFVPDWHFKQYLMDKGVPEKRILITGIPIHPHIQRSEQAKKIKSTFPLNLLISGGSLGSGEILKLIGNLRLSGYIRYWVLCGKNLELYDTLSQMNHPLLRAFPYIRSRSDMNQLYDLADGIVAKPGGVTMSEAISKKLPIFIFHALPGQEEFNLQHLRSLGLVFLLKRETDIEQQILSVLLNKSVRENWNQRIDAYERKITDKNLALTLQRLFSNSSNDQ
ncbi:MGDG synthase family glycosyltransferase [Ferviditalea candida]|uniref:UDP-glucuronosyltransferase n=1 Tax=Ferviditalea candida TaxID=3108399 RepID=A0ABU5ZIH3_9BACL|nr:UDP-glucuronosyltransferase [Paenibacillaceae bacterium T2]